jgi:ornithine carbamoyltransferase
VASESATALLGGHPLFLGSNDIQLGVNETLYDTSRVVSSMVDGIFARVGPHSDIETLSANSAVPVINALSDLYHPTQILADLLTLIETYSNPFVAPSLSSLSGLKIAWIGDSNNILNDMLLSFPRLNIDLSIATPKGYGLDQSVLDLSATCTKAEGGKGKISHTHDPLEAVSDADVVVTDTWCAAVGPADLRGPVTPARRISMGQEEEYDRRIRDFSGFQITSEMMKRGGAKPDWKFMHCLPRKQQEVDDEVRALISIRVAVRM